MGSSAETGMGSPIRKQKDFFGDQKKRVRKPLIPIGALLTAGILTVGLIRFRQRNSQLVQKLMGARVVVQVATVALMSVLLITVGKIYSGILTSPGI
ncbi:hypothetical protein AMTR_s00001p00271420 [Amborella trichopoda]|uniref:HIG1 domain-containing protein n=1 Tax=Amborella trichopoda TaxID=13333 RepID=W1NMU6_AMBTC|nr:hypothetical protein AMTR_s00001p00271420 [Amborella trichopoda]